MHIIIEEFGISYIIEVIYSFSYVKIQIIEIDIDIEVDVDNMTHDNFHNYIFEYVKDYEINGNIIYSKLNNNSPYWYISCFSFENETDFNRFIMENI